MGEVFATEGDERLDRAVRLFEFLARVQQVKSPSPRTVEGYQDVVWFHRLPAHPAVVSLHRTTGFDPAAATLVVDRVQRLVPPVAPDIVCSWLDGQVDDPTREPTLRKTRPVEIPADGPQEDDDYLPVSGTVIQSLEDHPQATEEFDLWLPRWRAWASDDLAARPVRDLYSRLFSIHGAVGTNPEELELVFGTACLAWEPDGHPAVQRHLLTSAAAIDFDDISGRLTVRIAPSHEALTVELDMLDPGLVHDARRIQDIRSAAQGFEANPIDRDEVAVLAQRLVHCLDPDGAYLDGDEPATPRPEALVSYAPALILRKRSQQGMIQIFETIAGQLQETGEVPEGILPLVDPNHVPDPGLSWEGQDGGIVEVDDEVFLPLPVNDAQLKIVRSVDHQAQTLVQGPPGTGKTHTAAVLISHLVAQGKRVLVTAQTDRALKEVRDKLPESIRPLSVAVVGAAREDMSQLKVAVERIAAEAVDYEGARAERKITHHLDAIDDLRRRRAGLYNSLVEAREAEVRHYEVHGYAGTIAAIAQAHQAEEPGFRWIGELVSPGPETLCPLDDAEIAEWRTLLLDGHVLANEIESGQDLLDPSFLPDPRAFADAVEAERKARDVDAGFARYASHAALGPLTSVDDAERRQLADRLSTLANEGISLKSRHETWIIPALTDIQRHKGATWRARRDQISTLVNTAAPLVTRLGLIVDVRVRATLDECSSLVPLARAVLAHVKGGATVRTDAAGNPRLGPLTSRVLRQASPLFEGVRVEGVPPTTASHLETFLTWVEAIRAIDALDRAWPAGTEIPPEDTLAERLQWHITELEQLERVLNFAAELEGHEQVLLTLGLPVGNWTDPDEIAVLAMVVKATAASLALATASEPLAQLEEQCAQASRWADANACVRALHTSVRGRNVDAYRSAYGRLHELLGVRQSIVRREELGACLASAAPRLHVLLAASPAESRWDDHLDAFSGAWRWAATGSWIRDREQVDVNSLKAELDIVEREIRRHVEGLTATRAWTHATSPERIDGRARADLQHYAQLVKRLGKGTGKYASQKRAEIRAAMGQCRSSVPVWILPIYRIAEQLRVTPGMFDVVIVDEASQAGLEATFLQYLAPKIVVIGDDKQVSPSAVGVDQQQLIDLAAQYLHDDPYRASWSDPLRSLFDTAKMRYGGLITLVEHRRCVPEIIGFSNRIAYEPDGIRLIPVRQYGADRLEPVKPVFLADGYTKGTTSKINPVEVEAIVDQVAKCLVDPRYDGLTFGIISLLGTAQAKAIEKALLERIPSEEWSARDLRCGDSADFQGSERDVMFLSMVAAPEPGRRLAALTMDMYVQRYNVAASRAKDQMWVFHSVPLAELSNSEDMRFALLDYCYGVANRPSEASGIGPTVVPEDSRVAPFDSLFEQRVFNRLIDRGYSVIPQYEVEGYRIDLVVVGPACKLAVECDGDAWHGREAYEKDIARQRDLERCGWRFFRIPEFRFYVDRPAALAPLWELLEQLDIHPSGWTRSPATPVAPATPPSVPSNTRVVAPTPDWRDASLVDETPVEIEEEELELDDEYVVPVRSEAVRPPASSMAQEKALHPPSARGAHDELGVRAQGRGAFSPYPVFSGRVTAAMTSPSSRLVDDLVAIVSVEGPVIGERLHQAHVRASGGQKVGSQIASALNKAIASAVRRGLLVEENPLGDAGIKPKTYRLPSQAEANRRQRGPRELHQIPPLELALVMTDAAHPIGWADEDALFRATLEPYGWVRLAKNVVAHLKRVKALAEESPAA